MRIRGFAISLAAALLAGTASPAAAAADVTLDEVYKATGVGEVPAEYVVLVDTSGSMNQDGRYDQVKQILESFLPKLRQEDKIALITFDSKASQVQRGQVADMADVIRRMPPANGPSTDIGAGIGGALDYLAKSGATQSATIVLLTDGKHEPPPDSPYKDTNGPAWAKLKQQAAEMTGMNLRGFAFPLANEASGAELLDSVVTNTEVLRLPPDQLVKFLSELPENLRRALLLGMLKPDLGMQVEVEWPRLPRNLDLSGADIPLKIAVTSNAAKLPLELRDLRISTELGTVTGLPARVQLDPGKQEMLSATLRPKSSGGFGFGITQRTVTGALTLQGRIDTPWRQVIEKDLSTVVGSPGVRAVLPVEGIAESGVSWLVIILVILFVLLVVAAMVVVWRRGNPRMQGSVVADPPEGAPVRIELTGRRRVRIDRGKTGRALGTTGRCVIKGQPIRDRRQPVLLISYAARGGRKITRTCPAGEHMEISGLRFWYFADERGIPFADDTQYVPAPH